MPELEKSIRSSTLVVLANSHNPTLMDMHFLLTTGMIKDPKSINESKKLITPALSIIEFEDQTVLNLDPERLSITARTKMDSPFYMGQIYCKSLPYIKAVALGINMEIELGEEFTWVLDSRSVSDLICQKMTMNKKLPDKELNITVIRDTKKILLDINFHYDIKDQKLGEIKISFIEEFKKNLEIARIETDKLFKK